MFLDSKVRNWWIDGPCSETCSTTWRQVFGAISILFGNKKQDLSCDFPCQPFTHQ